MGIETVFGYTCLSVEAFYVTNLLFYIFSEFTIWNWWCLNFLRKKIQLAR